MILFGTEAKEVYNNALLKDSTFIGKGVFEYFDMGGAMYRAFIINNEGMIREDFGTLEHAIIWLNGG